MHCNLRRQSVWALVLVTRPIMHQLTNPTRDVSAVFLAKFILRMHRNCHLLASRQYSDTNSATLISYVVWIFWRSVSIYRVTLAVDLMILNTFVVWHDQTLYQVSAKWLSFSGLKIENLEPSYIHVYSLYFTIVGFQSLCGLRGPITHPHILQPAAE